MERKPKYKEVVDWVKERLEKKELSPGDKLNSENELCELFGLSRQTVRHAIGVLEEEGIVARRQGSGTYISDNRMANLENKTRVAVVTTYVDSYIFPRTIQGIENTLFERGLLGSNRFYQQSAGTGAYHTGRHHSQGRCGGNYYGSHEKRSAQSEPAAAAEADGTENPDFIHKQLLSRTASASCDLKRQAGGGNGGGISDPCGAP